MNRLALQPAALDLVAALCDGACLDIGCGDGETAAAVAASGHVVVGIDTDPLAIEATQATGAAALQRSVFDRLPGEGRWDTALLVGGALRIGDDTPSLLARVRRLIDPRGRIVVSPASDDLARDSEAAGLLIRERHEVDDVTVAVLGLDPRPGQQGA